MTKRTKPGSDWRVACGARLRQAREAVPLTQAELAATLDVRQQAVSRWERGDAAPRDALRPRIARLVGRPAAELFAYSEPARYRVSPRDRHRAVVRLATRGGRSDREIAARLGITEARVRGHLVREGRVRSRRPRAAS